MSPKEFFRSGAQKLRHFAEAGAVLSALLYGLSFIPGSVGIGATSLLEKFIEHALPNVTLFTPIFALGAVGMTFYASKVAKLIRLRVVPVIQLLGHSAALGAGVSFGMFVLALLPFSHDLGQPKVFFGAGLLFTALFYEAEMVVFAVEGKLDHLFDEYVEVVWGVLGLLILVGAAWQAWHELSAAGERKLTQEQIQKQCQAGSGSAVVTVTSARGASASQPSSGPAR